ncbi:hypothetical protein [Pinibacter soli]|uniref:Uncharacterized protein n=1 Tax=Pinibacter soli TaxID=3044211 RepID=A0ABT6RDX2_9BACT|nr:hypothetical protein [Pinibacter soli]MDI3320779.1 hypothetical protein [Pinibacter soli]
MNNILTQDVQQIVKNSNARFFLIIWSSSQGAFFIYENGSIQNIECGHMASPAIHREQAILVYKKAVAKAEDHADIKDGQIDILPIPSFK